MAEHAAVGRERQAEHGGRFAAALAPGATTPQLVGDLRDVETEVARRPLGGETQRHALGDVFLLAGTKAQHRDLGAAVYAFQALELGVQQLDGSGRRGVVVVHHPDVLGAVGQCSFYTHRVAIGRAAVFGQLDHSHAARPALGQLVHGGGRGIADDQHFVDLGEAQSVGDQLFEVAQAIAIGHGHDGRALSRAGLLTGEHFEVRVAIDEDRRLSLMCIDHVDAFA